MANKKADVIRTALSGSLIGEFIANPYRGAASAISIPNVVTITTHV